MASCFLMLNDEESAQKVDIDELYERRKNRDLKQLSIFNKILNRIHRRIQITGRTKTKEKFIWFQVPEYLFGEPIYDKGHCIAYLISKLEENGFTIQYLHPNTLFVTWEHWVPSYLRNEVKKKTGITIDEKGNVVKKKGDEGFVEEMPPEQRNKTESNKNIYNPIKSYKPSGNLVYDKELFEKIEKKVTFV